MHMLNLPVHHRTKPKPRRLTHCVLSCAELYGLSHGLSVLSKLVAIVRIENFVSRTDFENGNLLISRRATAISMAFSQILVCKNEDYLSTPPSEGNVLVGAPPPRERSPAYTRIETHRNVDRTRVMSTMMNSIKPHKPGARLHILEHVLHRGFMLRPYYGLEAIAPH